MSETKLYVVTFAMDMVVAATSEEEAEAIARREQFFETANLDIDETREMTHLPGQWELDALVYGKPERTVGEWIEAGAAPAYVKTRDALRATQAKDLEMLAKIREKYPTG